MNVHIGDLSLAPARTLFRRRVTRLEIGRVAVIQFDMPLDYALASWDLAFRNGWTFDTKLVKSVVGQLGDYLPPVQSQGDPIPVRLACFARFRGNLQVTRFGLLQGWEPLGPRECVAIGNYLPSLPKDVGLPEMYLVSPLRAYQDSVKQDRALEVHWTGQEKTVHLPLLGYGWQWNRWFPFTRARDIGAVERMAFPSLGSEVVEFKRKTH